MKILAIDTSSRPASAALWEDDVLLEENYGNIRLTHSQTILPMVEHLLAATRHSLQDVDLFAVTAGPGSFTGLRIGLSAVKGMALALEKPCVPISTLQALAWNLWGTEGYICPAMDARVGQVYTALFSCKAGQAPVRVWEDQALTLDELAQRLAGLEGPIFLVGDGAGLCYNKLSSQAPAVHMAPAHLLYQRAATVAMAAAATGPESHVTPDDLAPSYLRLPQAERERLERQNNTQA